MIKILLAVRHPELRLALREFLAEAPDLHCITVASSQHLRLLLDTAKWEVLVLDLQDPDLTKLQTVKALHNRYPDLPIPVLSLQAADLPLVWIEAGARGYVSKGSLYGQLHAAIHTLSRGRYYFSGIGEFEGTCAAT
ncbi:response regulator [Candidatus Nitrospira bockiana]